jgi:hypothetical protein
MRSLALGVALSSWSATGNASELSVSCPALGEEESAALSARLHADLEVRHASGRMMVTCSAERLWVAWIPSAGAARQEEVLLGAAEAPTVEHAFEAADRLFSDRSLWTTEPAPAPQPPVAQPGPQTPPPADPATRPSPPTPSTPPRDAPVSERGPIHVGLSFGMTGELWSSEAAGAIGPRGGVVVGPTDWLKLSAAGGLRLALRHPDDVSATAVDGRLGGDASVLDGRVWLGLGVLLSRVSVRTGADRGSLEDSETPVAFEARALGSLGDRSIRLLAGPFIGVRPGPTVVRLDGAEVFRIPTLTAGLSVDLEVALLSF